MVKPVDYALIMHHAVRHVGLKLEGAAPAALSFAELTRGYSHPNPSDLVRVKLHEDVEDDRAAIAWVIRRAVDMLDGNLTVEGDQVSFAPGKGFDDLKWSGGKVERPGPDSKFGDPFSPIYGQFAGNVRENIGELTELRESMAAWGWISEFPALVDERGVVLVGNRRMKIAKDLGIQPVIKVLTLGFGDAADAERLKLAIASNLGSKNLSPNARKRLAVYLYNQPGWVMDTVAAALSVDTKTISTDLHEFGVAPKSKRGRPRKDKPTDEPVKKARRTKKLTREQEEVVGNMLDEGSSRAEIAEVFGVGEHAIQLARERHIARMEERQRLTQEALPPVFAETQYCVCPVCGHRHEN